MRQGKFNKKAYGILRSTWLFIDEYTTRISHHHIYLIAAGIAFNMLLYIIPLFLMSIYLINIFFGADLIAGTLENLLYPIFPPTHSAREIIKMISEEVYLISDSSSLVGWIGIVVLLWLSSTLLNSIRGALNLIFHISQPRIALISRIKDIFLTLILAIFIIASSYAIPMTTFILSFIERWAPDPLDPYISQFTILAISITSSTILFFLLFSIVPNGKVNLFVRIIGTIICVIAIEVSRYIFGWYLTIASGYGKFYGAYAVIVSMAVWIYYFNLIILFSAELSQFLFDRHKKLNGS